MAGSPAYKVYSADGEYIASFKYPMHAAMLLAGIGEKGTTIRFGHHAIMWTDFVDGDASESYDTVAVVVGNRANEYVDNGYQMKQVV